MKRTISPVRKIGGIIHVPGDKSIGHRAALLPILAQEAVKVRNFPDNADCRVSLEAARKLGVQIRTEVDGLVLTPPHHVSAPADTIFDCANSGTTARLLSGIVAGSNIEATITGDKSLCARPMKRIVDPLTRMGAELTTQDDHLPMTIRGRRLQDFEYQPPMASAQVKSALLLAGLASGCAVTIREEKETRDHTEIMLHELGASIVVRKVRPVRHPDPDDPRKTRMRMPESFRKEIVLAAGSRIGGGTIDIPGDISTAAFFFAAAAIARATITVEQVGLNPTRTAFLDHLKAIGCNVVISDRMVVSGEPRGNVTVTGRMLKGRKISGAATVGLIDEMPIVAVMAAFADGATVIRDAGELRFKESDRLQATLENLQEMGVKCGRLEDGLVVEGGTNHPGADFRSFGDHRIAMAFSVAALSLVGPSTVDDDSVVDISCPGFYDLLDTISI
ncbi:MAG: 3-phosphoshikimate 1-carboxyvinyltransferase [bacterium]